MKKYVLGLMLGTSLLALDVQAREITVTSVQLSGLRRVEKETVLAYAGVKQDMAINQQSLDMALKRLYATGLFADITLEVTESGVLKIKLVENPVINKLTFEGNEKINAEMLEKETQLKPRAVYSRAKVQEDVNKIVQLYKRAGRYATVVDPKIIQRDQNRVDLIFEIDEGPVAKISKINFIGNKHYSASELASEIMSKESRWYRIFSAAENYDAEKMNYDKELLRRFYAKKGYADFRIKSAVAELSPDKQSFVLNFVIDEGPKYEVEKVEIRSDLEYVDVNSLYEELEFEQGDWFDAEKMEKSVYALTDALNNKGHAFVEVVPSVSKNTDKATMKVVFNVREGERVFVNRININGNTRTYDEVIRREFRLDEGDAFNAAKIRASKRNIENLNYFSKVDITSQAGEDPTKADINVNVEEKSTGYFNVGIGYSTVDGALVRAGVTENNFRGKAQQLSANVAVSQRTQEYDLSFTEPYFLGRRLSAGIDAFMMEEDYQDEASYDTETMGGRLRFGWNYTDDLYQFVRYTYRQDEITNVDSNASPYIKAEEGSYDASVFGQSLVYDKRDNKMNTKNGHYLSLSTDVAGAGGDEKYIKVDAKAYKFYTFADYYTLKMFVNGGYITSFGDDDVRLFNRYYLGGSTLRGFAVAGIGARDKNTKDALGGNWMVYAGTELSFPIGLTEMGIKGKTFVDAGMLGKPDSIANNADVEYSSTPRVAAGVGLQWNSPMGQIDLDFAFPVVKEDYDETEVFRLNFGTRL